jgi:hypothetical protein
MKKITDSARGKDCTIRLPGRCCPGPENETVVFCHFRQIGISGMGYKTDAPIGAYGCAACHAYVDSHHDQETQLAFAEGCFRTFEIMWRLGILRA